jgi:hypothetical protein
MYIFPLIEIETIIFQYLDPLIDYPKVMQLNKYYQKYIRQDQVFCELKEFYQKKSQLKSPIRSHGTIKRIDFMKACHYGYLHVMKYIYHHQGINIHAYHENAFVLACCQGHFNIVKWLYETGRQENKFINIHVHNDKPFRWSCGYGCLEIVQWLYDLGIKTHSPIDISAHNHNAFRYGCQSNHYQLVKWLCSLNSNYTIEEDNDQIIGWTIKNFFT